GPLEKDVDEYLRPEPLIESDAPEIRAEAQKATAGAVDTRARAEKLTRYVNGLLDKKPTISLPSAREVLRTKVGDCNEHTALYVAMARSIGIPARIAVGLTYVRGITGAFYYHAWPEVYIDEGGDRGLWLPVDPTLNEFPADPPHSRPPPAPAARPRWSRQTGRHPPADRPSAHDHPRYEACREHHADSRRRTIGSE